MATILSHRGYWKDPLERNTAVAFERSFELGFGTETDVRDRDGALVISHDPPGGDELLLEDVLATYRAHRLDAPLALNVKSDGLAELLADVMSADDVEAFVFDMSVPDTLAYARRGMPFFTRQSEYEPVPPLYEQSAGVWMDCFQGDWFEEPDVTPHLQSGKRVCLVSPELHGREPGAAWSRWAQWACAGDPALMICSDRPEQLAEVMTG